MPSNEKSDEFIDLMRRSLIVQLGLAGVSQKKIRAIVRCDMKLVSEVIKNLSTKS